MRGRLRLLHPQLAAPLLLQATHPLPTPGSRWLLCEHTGQLRLRSRLLQRVPQPLLRLDFPCPSRLPMTLSVSSSLSSNGAWSTEARELMCSWQRRRGARVATSGLPDVEPCLCLSFLPFLPVPTWPAALRCLRAESINYICTRPSLFTDGVGGRARGQGRMGG